MSTRIIEQEWQRAQYIKFLQGQKLPFTASVATGKIRSTKQNRLQRKLVGEIADQHGDMTAEQVRGYCKLQIGVPILRDENADFRVKYDEKVKPLAYEFKLDLMQEPFSFPVTSLMTTKQKHRYLEGIYQEFSEQGYDLTVPNDFMNGREAQSEKAA